MRNFLFPIDWFAFMYFSFFSFFIFKKIHLCFLLRLSFTAAAGAFMPPRMSSHRLIGSYCCKLSLI